jgi:hypothetical protein
MWQAGAGLPVLRSGLGLSLAQAGWLLSRWAAGVLPVMGLLADGWGLRRCMLPAWPAEPERRAGAAGSAEYLLLRGSKAWAF